MLPIQYKQFLSLYAANRAQLSLYVMGLTSQLSRQRLHSAKAASSRSTHADLVVPICTLCVARDPIGGPRSHLVSGEPS